jgi:hypothetical protein
MKPIMSSYSKKIINPNYYSNITISGSLTHVEYITEEEFKSGKPGLAWIDNKTGIISFENPRKKLAKERLKIFDSEK